MPKRGDPKKRPTGSDNPAGIIFDAIEKIKVAKSVQEVRDIIAEADRQWAALGGTTDAEVLAHRTDQFWAQAPKELQQQRYSK